MDMNSEKWEQLPPMPDMEAELKRIRKKLRKRSFAIVLTSLVLVMVMLFGAVQYGIPALEKQYWDPNTSTYANDATDLELAIGAYTELFCPGYRSFIVDSVKTGFATYTIQTYFSNWTNVNNAASVIQKSAILSKNELTFSAGFWENYHTNVFNMIAEKHLKTVYRDTVSLLKKYPDYVRVLAAVHFPEDLKVSEVMDLQSGTFFNSDKQAYDGYMVWVSIRNREAGDDWLPACGFNPIFYGYGTDWIDDTQYPDLNYPTNFESHFKSSLRYLNDRM